MNDNNKYIMNIIDSKARFHKNRAKTPYEEKVKIILELQKINQEMRSKQNRKNNQKINKVWDVIL
ncbi:MAG: hypothetical protein KKF62_10900 [Bacteroidetes bacterium]|nr:hypothetical protein [Bacteroidota bacterium]MBU1799149.1 hypothetical protein [Bacteroidota bacterium]